MIGIKKAQKTSEMLSRSTNQNEKTPIQSNCWQSDDMMKRKHCDWSNGFKFISKSND